MTVWNFQFFDQFREFLLKISGALKGLRELEMVLGHCLVDWPPWLVAIRPEKALHQPIALTVYELRC